MYTLVGKEEYLEHVTSLSEADITGVDSESILHSLFGLSDNPALEKPILVFEVDVGEWLSLRMFPSDHDLLKSNLDTENTNEHHLTTTRL